MANQITGNTKGSLSIGITFELSIPKPDPIGDHPFIITNSLGEMADGTFTYVELNSNFFLKVVWNKNIPLNWKQNDTYRIVTSGVVGSIPKGSIFTSFPLYISPPEPTALDIDLAKAVLSLKEYFTTVDITIPSGNVYNPATGKTTSTSTMVKEVKISPPAPYSKSLENGSGVLNNDLNCLVLASDLTPNRAMKLFFDNTQFNIVTIKPIVTGEYVVAYELQLRT